jgi:hypothetical protein
LDGGFEAMVLTGAGGAVFEVPDGMEPKLRIAMHLFCSWMALNIQPVTGTFALYLFNFVDYLTIIKFIPILIHDME